MKREVRVNWDCLSFSLILISDSILFHNREKQHVEEFLHWLQNYYSIPNKNESECNSYSEITKSAHSHFLYQSLTNSLTSCFGFWIQCGSQKFAQAPLGHSWEKLKPDLSGIDLLLHIQLPSSLTITADAFPTFHRLNVFSKLSNLNYSQTVLHLETFFLKVFKSPQGIFVITSCASCLSADPGLVYHHHFCFPGPCGHLLQELSLQCQLPAAHLLEALHREREGAL